MSNKVFSQMQSTFNIYSKFENEMDPLGISSYDDSVITSSQPSFNFGNRSNRLSAMNQARDRKKQSCSASRLPTKVFREGVTEVTYESGKENNEN